MKARAALSCLALARAALVEFELDGEALPIDVSIEGCFSRGGLEAFVAQQHENITMPGCAPRDRACVVKRLGAAAGGFAESCRGGGAGAPHSDLRDLSVECLFPGSVWLRSDRLVHHCPRVAAPLPGVDYCHAVRAAGGEELLRDCRPADGVDGLVLTWGMAEGRYSFAAWLEPHAEERIAFDFEVALPPYADSGVALGVFLGHDAHLALTVDGAVREVLELERVTGDRHYMPDYQDPAALRASLAAHATAVLSRAGLEPADVDYVAYAENHMCCDRRVVAASDATVAYDVFAGPGSAFGAVWCYAAPKSTAGS